MSDSMMAVVYQGNGKIALERKPIPALKEKRDAIVKVELSTICTSDLHIRNGAVPRAVPGITLGHEFVGKIVQAGSALNGLKEGDRVAANCITFCGECWFCRRGFINNCEHGGWELGCRIDGCQAEYVRVPYADMGLTKISDSVSNEKALFLGDILSSGYFGAELAEIHPGDTVAVIGAGPVGLCAMQCARLFGAARIIAVELDPFRRKLALEKGIADLALNPEEQEIESAIREVTEGRGADAVIEAAGGNNTMELAWRAARPNAVVALVAMYERDQVLPLPKMYGKNLKFKTGGVDAVHCAELMKLLESGRLDPSFLITQKAPLNEIMTGYHVFENHLENCLKWAVTPPVAQGKEEKEIL